MNRKKYERPKSESHAYYDTKKQNEYSKEYKDNLFDNLANLMSEINLKQKLNQELALSQCRLSNLEQHYENKLQKLQTTIQLTQEERDTVISSLGNTYNNNNLSGILRKVKNDYEQKLNFIQKESKSLHSAKEGIAKYLRDQSQYENRLQSLKYEVNDKKYIKEEPNDFHNHEKKEETTKHEEDAKTLHMKIDYRKAEIRMLNLKSKSLFLDDILKRKQEELISFETNPAYNFQKDASGNYAHQKNSIQTWINLERDISSLSVNKQTLYSLKKHLESLLHEQKKLHSDFDDKQNKLYGAQIQKPDDENVRRDIEDEIEAMKANLNCVDGSIKELEEIIMQVEDSKTVSESLELIDRVHNLPEAIYILEKLVQMSLDTLCLVTQKDIDMKELETKMQQLEKENEIQRRMIEYMMSSQESVNEKSAESMATTKDKKIRSILSSTSSSGSISRPDIITSTQFKDDYGKNKQKHKTVPAQNVVNASKNIDKQFSRVTRIRLPNIPSFLKRDKSKISPKIVRKKIERQVSMSPILIKQATFIITPNTHLPSKTSSKLSRLNIPMSTPARRRVYTRNENDLTRQTSNTPSSIEQRSKGVIQPYQGKILLETPLECTHITEGHSRAVLAVYATDDKLFSASKDKTVKIWDLNNGKEIQTLGGHPNNVEAVKYDENSQLVFSVSSSYVRVWDMRISKAIKTLCSSGIVNNGSVLSSQIPIGEMKLNDIALNNYGRTLYMATGDKVKIWDLRKFTVRGKLSSGNTATVMRLAVGQFDNKDVIVTGSKDHYITMFEVGEEAAGTYNPTFNLEPPHYDSIQTLALRNQMLFSGSRDYAINKWDLDKQELVTSVDNAHNDWVCGLAVVPDQPLLFSVCRSGFLKMWSESTCFLLGIIKAHDSLINAVAANSTHAFTAAHDGTIKLWQVNKDFVTF